jgi:hypothetical protein
MSFLRADAPLRRYCCDSVFGREPHASTCPRRDLCDDCDFGMLGAGHTVEHVREPRTVSDDGQEVVL